MSAGVPRDRAGPGWRITLIDFYLMRLLAAYVAAAFAVIFSVTMLERALRLATQMAALGAHLRFLPEMIWNLAPHYVALGVPDAFLIGMLLTLSRLDGDLEIEAMLASGFSLGRIVCGLAGAAVVVAVVNLVFLGVLEPLGFYGYRAARAEAMEAGWTAEAQAWAFHGRGGAVTLTAARVDETGRGLGGVFIDRRSASGADTVLTAGRGALDLGADGRTATLALGPGRLLALRPGRPAFAGAFGGYSLADPYPIVIHRPARGATPQELTLTELATARPGPALAAAHSELYARLARTLALLAMPFLALPMAIAGRGGQRVAGLALAGGVSLALRQTIRLTQRLAAVGRIAPLPSMAVVLATFVAVTAWLFASSRRLHGDNAPARLLRRVSEMAGRLSPPPPPPRGQPSVGGYLRRSIGASVLVTAVVLVGLLAMIDLFERTEDILERGLGALGLVRYVAFRIPVLAEQSIGLATVVGAAFAFVRLDRGGEMVAVRSLGISLTQLARMCLPVGLAASGACLFLAEVAAPASQLALARWWNAAPQAPAAAPHWFRAGPELVRADVISADGARLSGLTVYRRDHDDLITGRMSARTAAFDGAVWRLAEVDTVQIVGRDVLTAKSPALAWITPARPRPIADLAASPLQISARTAWRALNGAAPTDLSQGYLQTRLHRAFTEPLAPLIMLLLALPLALSPAGTGPSAGALTWVLGMGLLYVVADGVSTAAGLTGLAPPLFAAWAAPAVFLSIAATAFIERRG